MSGFLGFGTARGEGMGIVLGGTAGNDESIQPTDYRFSPPQMTGAVDMGRATDILWPRSSFQGTSDNGATVATIWESAHQMWEWNFPPTGVHVRKKISGVTKDSTGAVLAGATVQIFNTSTGLLVDTVVSDSAGNYYASDPNAVNCFAVAYEAGSPDVAGTTKNNLTGT